MDYFQDLRSQIRMYLSFAILVENALVIGLIWVSVKWLGWPLGQVALCAYGVSFIITIAITFAMADFTLQPLKAVWQAIVHVSSRDMQTTGPDVKKLLVGRELVTRITDELIQAVSASEHPEAAKSTGVEDNFIINNLPVPLFVLNAERRIAFANKAASTYLGRETTELVGQEAALALPMSFPNELTLESWLYMAKQSALTTSNAWERVRLDVSDNRPTLLFDLAAYYNRGNASGFETLLVLFDHTKRYSQDDQAISFMALSVHELRTPLSLLRGYIEALDEETNGNLSPVVKDFINKMNATAQQLTAFVNTMLNVARVDNDQLVLKLHEEDWGNTVKAAVDMMSLRGSVRGISLQLSIADKLPLVGIDRNSIQEVIDNLLDNAIKYSGQAKQIDVSTYLNGEGLVETSVKDYGVGIAATVLPHLFTKFYRDHRNRAQIGGTGLGLYLSKAVVKAHSGNIWVKSREGQGSTFSFTVKPYAMLAEEAKSGDNKEITRSPHGWIKNHSLYRR